MRLFRRNINFTQPARLVYRGECVSPRDTSMARAREDEHARRCPNSTPECARLREVMRELESEVMCQTGQRDLDAHTIVSHHFGEGVSAQEYFRDTTINTIFDHPADAAFVHKLSDMEVLDVSALPADVLRRVHARLALASCAAQHIRMSRQPDATRDAFLVNTVSALAGHIGGGIELRELLHPAAAAA